MAHDAEMLSNMSYLRQGPSDYIPSALKHELFQWPPIPINYSAGLSEQDLHKLLLEQFSDMAPRSNFSTFTQYALIVAFALLICFGALGNGLVIYVVFRNPKMRTPRNIFIINLAISDMTLCLFTQPFNLLKVSMAMWRLGEFMCKFVPMFSGTNVFVSTMSITAIALDRFQVIVYPTRDSMKRVSAAGALVAIWLISLLMASPLLVFNVVEAVEPVPGIISYYVCIENPTLQYEKGAYSIASMLFQYIVPILIVSVAHARICNKLKYRLVHQQQQQQRDRSQSKVTAYQERRNKRDASRKRRTNTLLVMIACIFVCSWLPLNVFNIIADFNGKLFNDIDQRSLVFPMCHLLVLSSACINPVLYGWLNENFRREFKRVLCCPCCLRCCIRKTAAGGGPCVSTVKQTQRCQETLLAPITAPRSVSQIEENNKLIEPLD